MPPPGHEPFLRAICADPADDTVRLAYADWLDENGDPTRAEFIRVQIELSAVVWDSERGRELRDRNQTLLRAHQNAWLGELPGRGAVLWESGVPFGTFHRGLPAVAAVLSGPMFARLAAPLFEVTPIEHLIFPRVPIETIRDALGHSCVASVTGFTVIWTGPQRQGDALCEVLTRTPHLRGIRDLNLDHKHITDAGAACLAQAAILAQLKTLSLAGNRLSETGTLAIVDRLSPDHIEKVTLPGAALSETTRTELQRRFGGRITFR